MFKKRILSMFIAIVMVITAIPTVTVQTAATTLQWLAQPGIKDYSAGEYHSVVVKEDGSLWTWGDNYFGTLGLGVDHTVIVGTNTPTQVGTDNDWVSASAGISSTVALKEDGSIWAWGRNGAGQLGNGTLNAEFSPVQIGTDTDWASIFMKGAAVFAIKTNGNLWAWGTNYYGGLGDGTTISRSVPTLISTANDWSSISSGGHFVIATKTNGALWSWGDNLSGNLGDGTTISKFLPTRVGTANDWSVVSAGGTHSMAIRANGSLWTWGSNRNGQLGIGTTVNSTTPVQVSSSVPWTFISAGSGFSAGIKSDGSLWTWGGISGGVSLPTKVGADNDWISISSGGYSLLAMKTDGSLWVCGIGSSTPTLIWGGSLSPSVDTSALEALIALAKAKDGNLYTPTSWAILQSAITSAETLLLANPDQTQVDDEIIALQAAINQLVQKEMFTVTHKINDDDPRIIYNPTWTYFNDTASGFYNDDERFTDVPGAYAEFTFYGTGVSIIGAYSDNLGEMVVYLNNAPVDFVTLYSPTLDPQKDLSTMSGLPQDWYTVKIVCTGGKHPLSSNPYITLDAIEYTTVYYTGATVNEDDAWVYDSDSIWINDNELSEITYSYGWTYLADTTSGFYDDDEHFTNVPEAYAEFEFTGTSIAIVGALSTNLGIMEVHINGVPVKTVDLYSPFLDPQRILFSVSGLPNNQPNIIKIIPIREKNDLSTATYITSDVFVYK